MVSQLVGQCWMHFFRILRMNGTSALSKVRVEQGQRIVEAESLKNRALFAFSQLNFVARWSWIKNAALCCGDSYILLKLPGKTWKSQAI